MKRLRWIATLLMATALVASACTGDDGTSTDGAGGGGSGSGEQVTLDFWVFGEIAGGSFYETLVAEFETTYPDIDIDLFARGLERLYKVIGSRKLVSEKVP